MKTKKFFALMSMLLFASVMSLNVYAACGVNSDSSKNTGHCRANGDAGDTCYKSGSGPACSHNVAITPPVE